LPLEELENLRKNLLAEVSKKQMRQSFDRPSLSPWSHEE
jgi:hypothetical protein